MKQKLEKIVKETKKILGRGIVGAGLIFGGVSYGAIGRLDIQNYASPEYTNGTQKTGHFPGASEDIDAYDEIYGTLFPPSGINSKLVSIIPGYELKGDVRPEDSNSLIDLELSLHSQSGNPIPVSNLGNELRCNIDPTNKGWIFGDIPITLWERDMNDPNIVYFLGDIRKVEAKNGGVIPLPDLNGNYNSEEPYMLAQTSFKDLPSDFDENGRVDLRDFALLANDWQKTGNRLLGDITDSNDAGLPDGKVDFYDLMVFCNDYLKEE